MKKMYFFYFKPNQEVIKSSTLNSDEMAVREGEKIINSYNEKYVAVEPKDFTIIAVGAITTEGDIKEIGIKTKDKISEEYPYYIECSKIFYTDEKGIIKRNKNKIEIEKK